ncbi:MAG: pilus assembly protein [Rhodobacteraceae bacterium]|nr:MAG: pilus assembly protein [Paracoccaceae bacterium]
MSRGVSGVGLRLREALAAWRTSESGAAAVLFAFALVPLMIAAGVVIDGGSAYLVRDRLAKSLDAAGLAAARVSLSDRAASDARRFFDVNFRDGYMGAEVTDFTVSFSEDRELLTVSAEATMPTSLMRIAGFRDVTVRRSTVVQRLTRGLEVALVMDNTGSMRGGDMIGQMKAAATELVNILYAEEDALPDLWISLIPYTSMVNIGAARVDWLRTDDPLGGAPSPYVGSSWKGCVLARPGGEDETDTPPDAFSDAGRFQRFLYPSAVDNWWLSEADPTQTFIREGAANNEAHQNDATGPNLGCGPAITPLTNQRKTVLSAIDEMLPWHRGGTTSNLGMVWGWRTISPEWRGLWGDPTPAHMPLDYDEPLMDKAVVLLTDGDNQFYRWPQRWTSMGGSRKSASSTVGGSDATAYGRLHDLLPGGTLAQGQTLLDVRLARMCEALKERGVFIYTIVFGTIPGAATHQLYRDCASTPSDYFPAPDGDTLRDAFRNIGQRLSDLRVVR